MEIQELLQMPDNLDGKDIQTVFENIAKKLMKEFCILCGTKKFYFTEIEFYYYDKVHFNNEWNWETYPRTGKKAGDLFFHYSGFDICFDSSFDNGKFGGILIRSLKDENGAYITGPSVCLLEILNTCSELGAFPVIINNDGNKDCEMGKPLQRFGIENDTIPLCYFEKKLFEKYSNNNTCCERFKNAKWDFDRKHNGENPKLADYSRYYNRFKLIDSK